MTLKQRTSLSWSPAEEAYGLLRQRIKTCTSSPAEALVDEPAKTALIPGSYGGTPLSAGGNLEHLGARSRGQVIDQRRGAPKRVA
jgi:hypothetical protein